MERVKESQANLRLPIHPVQHKIDPWLEMKDKRWPWIALGVVTAISLAAFISPVISLKTPRGRKQSEENPLQKAPH